MRISGHPFTENAVTEILPKRYLQPGESIEGMLDRVCLGNDDYYNLMASGSFLPNSPTLMNAGVFNEDGSLKGTLSACFKFDVQDSMFEGPDSISGTHDKAGRVLKFGGGTGYVFSDLRPKGSLISSTHKAACGPVQVMRHYHSLAKLITQGGKREAAQMGILSVNHPDIRDFIHCKDEDPQGLSTFNISVALDDEFMEEVIGNIVSTIGNGKTGLLWEMAESAWRTGDPGCYFIDRAEEANPTPWLGKLTGTNPCGEVPLLNNEPCNLGSLNLSKYVTPGLKVDWTALEEDTRLAVQFLDDILDANTFPHPDIEKAAYTTRKLGLGVMGWADMLATMNIHYSSGAAVDLGERVMQHISATATNESIRLAYKKGVCPAFADREDAPYRRNATLTCIAPTGTISTLLGASNGIEPHFQLDWERTMGDGTVLQESIRGRFGDFIPQVAEDISWQVQIAHQSSFQKYTDLAVSKTINMRNDATIQDIYDVYIAAWESNCKGITVYRNGSRDVQVLNKKVTTALPKDISVENYVAENKLSRRVLPATRQSLTHEFTVGDFKAFATVGFFEDGTPAELFITSNKEGSTIAGLMDAFAMQTSFALQFGVPLEFMVGKMTGARYEPSGFTSNPDIRTATSITDYVFRWLAQFIPETGQLASKIASGNLCPECGGSLVYSEGCEGCVSCGYSRCG